MVVHLSVCPFTTKKSTNNKKNQHKKWCFCLNYAMSNGRTSSTKVASIRMIFSRKSLAEGPMILGKKIIPCKIESKASGNLLKCAKGIAKTQEKQTNEKDSLRIDCYSLLPSDSFVSEKDCIYYFLSNKARYTTHRCTAGLSQGSHNILINSNRIFRRFLQTWHDPTDLRTDQRTDTPSYWDA